MSNTAIEARKSTSIGWQVNKKRITWVRKIACKSGLFLETTFSFCSTGADTAGGSSQLFLILFADPAIASETLEIPAAIVTIFFLLADSAAAPDTMGETFTPDSLLPGEMEALRAGEACLRPFGDGCLYLDGTMMAGSLDVLLFSSRAAAKLGTVHFEGTGDADLFPFPAGDGSLSATATFFFPTDDDLLFAPAGDENLEGLSETFVSSEFPTGILSRGARGCLDLPFSDFDSLLDSLPSSLRASSGFLLDK